MKKIAVIGAGYVGLVTGACFAQKGNLVTIVENNQEKIDHLLRGAIPFYEPNLDTIVQDAL
ncbi:UDP-glucose 6-dehydrogenase, partial [bacterium]|nr:UDP-glucose 6-dehydrogenase [bacterium]